MKHYVYRLKKQVVEDPNDFLTKRLSKGKVGEYLCYKGDTFDKQRQKPGDGVYFNWYINKECICMNTKNSLWLFVGPTTGKKYFEAVEIDAKIAAAL